MADSQILRRILAVVVALTVLHGAAPAARALDISINSTVNRILPRQFPPGSMVRMIINSSTLAGTTIQWYHDGHPIVGATSASLQLDNLTTADAGNYHVVVVSSSTVSTSNTLTVNVLPYPDSPVDPSFTAPAASTPLPNYNVQFVAPDDSVVVANIADTARPTVRLNADGSLDSGFTYPSSAGSILAGYSNKAMITSAAPFRLNPDGTPNPLTLPAVFNPAVGISAAVIQPDGKLLLAQGNQIVRLNADDSIDSSFSFTNSPASVYSVSGLKLDPSGRVYVTAWVNNSVPGNSPSGWTVVMRLAANGAEDTGFANQTPPLLRGGVAIYPLADGRILLYRNYEGIIYWNILTESGTPDSSWIANTYTNFLNYPPTVDLARNVIYFVDYSGTLRRQLITATTLVDDSTFYPGGGSPGTLAVTPSGKLLISGAFAGWDDHASPGIVRLYTDHPVTTMPPVVNAGSSLPKGGAPYALTSTVTGTGPFTYQWLALDGQPMPSDTTSASLTIPSFSVANLGRYQLRVTGAAGTVLSNVTSADASTGIFYRPFLANLSGRAFVGTGDDTAIAGIVVKIYAGALGVPTLLRGAGPALQPYGVVSTLPNPVLNLYNGSSEVIGNNDTWGGNADITSAANATGAFPFSPTSNDAALLRDFGSGNFSLQLTDGSGASGVGLLEIYRRPATNVAGEILNLSLRARTAPGERVATAGFVIADPQNLGRSARMLLRVIGPSLSKYGVAAPLADPVLTLYDGQGRIISGNDNWRNAGNAAEIAAVAGQVGAFALDSGSNDSALFIDLPAGIYSIQASGAAGTPDSGVVLIEIYIVP